MEATSLIVVASASLLATFAKDIVSSLWEELISPRLRKEVTLRTRSGQSITITSGTELGEKRIHEIIASLEQPPKASAARK